MTSDADPAEAGHPAGTQAEDGVAVDAVAGDAWSEIQATFVDDPRGSVTQAADMVDEAVEAFITTVHDRQATLASSWQVQDTDTEGLRAAFQEYRSFWTSVTELSQSA